MTPIASSLSSRRRTAPRAPAPRGTAPLRRRPAPTVGARVIAPQRPQPTHQIRQHRHVLDDRRAERGQQAGDLLTYGCASWTHSEHAMSSASSRRAAGSGGPASRFISRSRSGRTSARASRARGACRVLVLRSSISVVGSRRGRRPSWWKTDRARKGPCGGRSARRDRPRRSAGLEHDVVHHPLPASFHRAVKLAARCHPAAASAAAVAVPARWRRRPIRRRPERGRSDLEVVGAGGVSDALCTI